MSFKFELSADKLTHKKKDIVSWTTEKLLAGLEEVTKLSWGKIN